MIDINNESGYEIDESGLVDLAAFAFTVLHIHEDAELSIVAVDEETMAAYNKKYMGHTGATDVLAFPMDEMEPGRSGSEPSQGMLGDIVICPAVTSRQAQDLGRTPQQEAAYLLVHGLLHLLGFDHAEPEEKRVMFTLNDEIIAAWDARDANGST